MVDISQVSLCQFVGVKQHVVHLGTIGAGNICDLLNKRKSGSHDSNVNRVIPRVGPTNLFMGGQITIAYKFFPSL